MKDFQKIICRAEMKVSVTECLQKYVSTTTSNNSINSAHHIIGTYLENRDKSMLYDLSKSDSLWERRIAIMSTFYFIKKSRFSYTLHIAEQLLGDQEDLIRKAVGWMLREVGKRDLASFHP